MFLRNPDGASQQDIPPGPDGPFPFQKENLKSSGNDCARAAREGRRVARQPAVLLVARCARVTRRRGACPAGRGRRARSRTHEQRD